MPQDFAEKVALKIMNEKLRGKSTDAVYKLTDAELAVLRGALSHWTIGMSQILANRIGLESAERMVKQVLALPEIERIALAESCGASLEKGETPDDADFAAFITVNNSDELAIEAEIARRERLQ